MILTCPDCGTQYVVKDGAIPPQGRQVRCASCKHSWHQDPEPAAEANDGSEGPESLAEATLIQPRSGPEAEQRAYEEAMVEQAEPEAAAPPEQAAQEGHDQARDAVELAAEHHAQEVSASLGPAGIEAAPPVETGPAAPDWKEPPQAEATNDEFSPFPAPDEVASKGRSPILTMIIIILVVAALAAAFYFLAPGDWKGRVGMGTGVASQLALVTTHMDRQRLASGNELLTVTGRVINPTAKEQSVPPLQAQLKSRAGKIVYSWTIAPPARTLAPGSSASFNSAEVNVPPGGDELTLTLGEPAL